MKQLVPTFIAFVVSIALSLLFIFLLKGNENIIYSKFLPLCALLLIVNIGIVQCLKTFTFPKEKSTVIYIVSSMLFTVIYFVYILNILFKYKAELNLAMISLMLSYYLVYKIALIVGMLKIN